ncbi:hypothetical protein P691DRAFT_816356 [Macrolepiota fuliginosa MF-IS2]|uniref:Uncharacterized protein n=1 Tax=Macrolepiota fuliginosa MF-IS2 TaxID=1400762 RepID=A0A9P5WZR7_9AGAR|nr:hypothetical protein P691DRAFT_816356 [Macrolepiota fuliginosa MF-IS2]
MLDDGTYGSVKVRRRESCWGESLRGRASNEVSATDMLLQTGLSATKYDCDLKLTASYRARVSWERKERGMRERGNDEYDRGLRYLELEPVCCKVVGSIMHPGRQSLSRQLSGVGVQVRSRTPTPPDHWVWTSLRAKISMRLMSWALDVGWRVVMERVWWRGKWWGELGRDRSGISYRGGVGGCLVWGG